MHGTHLIAMVPGRANPVMGRPAWEMGRMLWLIDSPPPAAVRMDVPGRMEVPGRIDVPGRIALVLGRIDVPGLSMVIRQSVSQSVSQTGNPPGNVSSHCLRVQQGVRKILHFPFLIVLFPSTGQGRCLRSECSRLEIPCGLQGRRYQWWECKVVQCRDRVRNEPATTLLSDGPDPRDSSVVVDCISQCIVHDSDAVDDSRPGTLDPLGCWWYWWWP